MSVRELADACEIDKSTVHRILRKDLGLRNVASVWVPHELSDLNKQNRVNCAENLRRHFHQEGMESFCNKYAVQDETWVYLKGQPRKQQSCFVDTNSTSSSSDTENVGRQEGNGDDRIYSQ